MTTCTDVVRIALTQGFEAMVDADILERELSVELPARLNWTGRICDVKWFAAVKPHTVYAVATLGGYVQLRLHRVVLQAKREQIVDHRDGNGLNNLRSNLRFTEAAGNSHNRCRNVGSTTGYKGVSFNRLCSKFEVSIRFNRKKIHLGMYKTAEEAARVYDAKAVELFGEFAKVNFPD
jgi:hypothetical protein